MSDKYTGLSKEANHTPKRNTAATGSGKEFRVLSVLSQGKANAVSSQYLADILGFKSVRELQKEIEYERRNGAVILSTCENGGGYFLPADEGEVKSFIRTLESRARNTFAVLKSARNYIHQGETNGRSEVD